MKTLNEQQIKLLNYFLSQKSNSESEIAGFFDVSEKTISNYIDQINELLKDFDSQIVKDHGVYRINIKNRELLEQNLKWIYQQFCSSFLLEQNEGRYINLLKRILFSKNGLSLEEIAGKMFISESSLYKIQKAITKDCERYGLQWKTKRNVGNFLEGPESKKREFFVTKIFEICNQYPRYVCDRLIRIVCPYYKETKEITHLALNHYRYNISDNSFRILTLYTSLAIERMKYGFYLEDNVEISASASVHKKTSHAVDDIFEHFAETKQLQISSVERDFIVMLILNNTDLLHPYTIRDDAKKMVDEVLNLIKDKYHVDFLKSNKLKDYLSFQLSCVLDKKTNIQTTDTVYDAFKTANPYEHILTYTFYSYLYETKGIKLSVNERSNIAALFSSSLINDNPILRGISILLVTSFNQAYAILLEENIKKYICPLNDFMVIGSSEIYGDFDYDHYPVILTTELDYAERNRRSTYIGEIRNLINSSYYHELIRLAIYGFSRPKKMLDCISESRFYHGKKLDFLKSYNITKNEYIQKLNEKYDLNIDPIAYINSPSIIFNNFVNEDDIKLYILINEDPLGIDHLHSINITYVFSYNPEKHNMYFVLKTFDFLLQKSDEILKAINYADFYQIVLDYIDGITNTSM